MYIYFIIHRPLAQTNPLRYRSYYYDGETGYYHLKSRYYSPEVGWFLNADGYEIIDGGNDHIIENNLFTYWFSNPVNMTDDTGHCPNGLQIWLKLVLAHLRLELESLRLLLRVEQPHHYSGNPAVVYSGGYLY